MPRSLFRPSRLSFSLVELLVVIAILAILISLLAPSLNRAIKASRKVVCLNNLKEVGLAYQIYGDDFDGYYPPIRNGNNNWFNMIQRDSGTKGYGRAMYLTPFYQSNFSAWDCPENERMKEFYSTRSLHSTVKKVYHPGYTGSYYTREIWEAQWTRVSQHLLAGDDMIDPNFGSHTYAFGMGYSPHGYADVFASEWEGTGRFWGQAKLDHYRWPGTERQDSDPDLSLMVDFSYHLPRTQSFGYWIAPHDEVTHMLWNDGSTQIVDLPYEIDNSGVMTQGLTWTTNIAFWSGDMFRFGPY